MDQKLISLHLLREEYFKDATYLLKAFTEYTFTADVDNPEIFKFTPNFSDACILQLYKALLKKIAHLTSQMKACCDREAEKLKVE
jgi:hypothetical protein